MTTDYRGPMKTGLWWSSPDSWQTRYERYFDRLRRLTDRLADVETRHNMTAMQGRECQPGSKEYQTFVNRWHNETQDRKSLLRDIAALKRKIRDIEDGYCEP